jgi:PAS domain S-box-containing protein
MSEGTKADSLHILLVEDNSTDALLIEEFLLETGAPDFAMTCISRLDGALASLREHRFDVVLLDLGLPDSQGLDTFAQMQCEYPTVPILILSGLEDEELAVRAVIEGAQDFLVKGKINSTMLSRTIRYAIERKRSEQRLKASEVGYRRLFETTQDGIFILDAGTGKITDANPFLEQLLEYKVTEFIGKRLWEIAPFRDKKANQAAFATLKDDGCIVYSDLPLATKGGRFIDVEFVSNIYTVGDRKVIQCNIRDITKRKLAEAKLYAEIAHRQRLEAETERIFDLSLDMLCIAGFDGFFKRLNPAWEHSLGYSRKELMARPFLDFVHPEDADITANESRKHPEGQDTENFENRYRCKDGSYKWLAWHVKSVPEEQLVYAVARDVTESKKTGQALAATMIQLKRSNSDLQHFASIASHDLQEPLRAIQAFGERLQTKYGAGLEEEAQDYLTRMQKAAGRMRSLIQDLLAYSRVTTKTRPFTPVDLDTTARAVLADLAIRLEETGGRVEIGDLPTIAADAMQMRQLFQNLIANALKFHRDDEPPIVRIYTQRPAQKAHAQEGQLVCVVVEDNGIGFDEKYAERIFAPFERLHTQNKYGGTGIGLAICRKIAERHGGSISVTSVPGQGSKFLIELALRQIEVESTVESAADSMQVLVVDDVKDTRQLLDMAFGLAGHRTATASSGTEALELIAKQRFDAVVLDIEMPHMDGWEVLEAIRLLPFGAQVPVILFTAHQDPDMEARAREAGAYALLNKPLLPKYVIAMTESAGCSLKSKR